MYTHQLLRMIDICVHSRDINWC